MKDADGVRTNVHVPVPQPEPERAGVRVAPAEVPADQQDGDHGAGAASPAVSAQRKSGQDAAAVEDGALLDRARREDACYWEKHRRPISANELRKRLRVGSKRARSLVVQLRADALRAMCLVESGQSLSS
ncbi:hypothetical protein FF36_02111 [Frankia torreyi]|uniref:Uncharacterized protein n=1 Tax=Frankia torreyi TaxID=1856 RepID=A0A0D8BHP0_9ACTN|nr:hypothetical protein FF36_02111 [Frankia torreyi]